MDGPRRIVVDTDPGQDDAVALLLALASPEEIEVLAVTAVAGNVPLALTARNARIVCELAGRGDVPVHAGCAAPLTGALVTAEHVHGRTGLDGPDLPEPRSALRPGHGVDLLVETLRREAAGTVTICALGPLTNLAAALERAPDIAGRIGEVVLMGGAYFEVGNVTPAAEFNIHVDPEAAEVVFRSGAPVTVVPLDVTHKVRVTAARKAAFAALGAPVGTAVAALTGAAERFDAAKYGTDGAPLHDPCVIARLIRPELFSGRRVNVEIERRGRYTRGMTVADWWGVSGRAANATFLGDVDAEGVFALLIERLARYSEVSAGPGGV